MGWGLNLAQVWIDPLPLQGQGWLFQMEKTDHIVLSKFDAFRGTHLSSHDHCNYIGRLYHENTPVALTGCLEQPGDKMDVTIVSKHLGSSKMFQVDFHGNVEEIESELGNGKSSTVAREVGIDGEGGLKKDILRDMTIQRMTIRRMLIERHFWLATLHIK